MDYSETEMQAFRWEQSYAAAIAVLQRHGVEHAFGEGDFWLFDDNYGYPEHLLYIFRMAALTQGLVAELQSVLRAPALEGWTIRVVLDLREPDGGQVPPEGLTVSSQAVEEHWNREALRARFGSAFDWASGWQAAVAPSPGGAGTSCLPWTFRPRLASPCPGKP